MTDHRPTALKRTGYRLPTEAEWEYACRSGTLTSRYYGRSTSSPGAVCLVSEEQSGDEPGPWCGSLLPNDLGLFDMLGNVYEWCQDQYEPEPEGKDSSNDMNIIDEDPSSPSGRDVRLSSGVRPLGEP